MAGKLGRLERGATQLALVPCTGDAAWTRSIGAQWQKEFALFLVLLTYTQPLEAVDALVEEHRAFLHRWRLRCGW